MNQPNQPQQPIKMRAGNGIIEVCPHCSTPVPPAHSYQDAGNQVWLKKACPTCNAVFSLEGPFRSHGEANPTVYK
jgi:hypothetical protein